MDQLALFDARLIGTARDAGRMRLDTGSERLLATYRAVRLAEGANASSVAREVSQLRGVAREAGTPDEPAALRMLCADLTLVAEVLREPRSAIARSTGRTRLLAVQRFIRVMARRLGRDSDTDLVTLDALLPARRSTGWHTTGTLVAGAAGRRRRRAPTLSTPDLRCIVDAAGDSAGGYLAHRDRALAALHCFSGLRPEEIVRLRWEDLRTDLTTMGRYGMTASVCRDGRRLQLLLPAPAADAIDALAGSPGRSDESRTGRVFRARGAAGRPLSYRAARTVLQRACRQAGLPVSEAVALRAAFAHWLRSQGLSDHEAAAVLGLAKVRSLDRLLRHHAALDAQRAVRESLLR